MLETGHVKVHRSIVNWEWYDDLITYKVFTHLIFTVNWKDDKWRGIPVKRGQRIGSYAKLAAETKLSIQNIRTAIKHLKSTGEVTYLSTAEYSLFTVNNYDQYQTLTDEPTNDQQSINKPLTNDQQLDKKANKAKKAKNIKNSCSNDADALFERIWKLYPIKLGKSSVKKVQRENLFKIGYDELVRAVERYVSEQQKKCTELKYYKHGSTFFNNGYVDYLDENFQEIHISTGQAKESLAEKLERENKADLERLEREYGGIEI